MRHVYLAGPITDCNRWEANDWRAAVNIKLDDHGIIGVSPLRCEPLMGERYTLSNADPRFGTAKAIGAKNFYDVQTCDITLAYMPRKLNERRLSVGTLGELHWAHALGKRTILVSDYPFLTEHPVVLASSSWVLSTLDEAIDVLIGVLGVYAHR